MSAVETETDVLHYKCIPENQLDLAFQLGVKGERLPQTCLSDEPARTPEALAEVIGRPPTSEEWATYSYKWFREFDPDRVLFVPIEALTPVVPVPASIVFMLSTIALWLVFRRR